MLLAASDPHRMRFVKQQRREPGQGIGVLRVGTEGVYSPFSYHDPATGQLVGYDVDVAKAVGEKLGVKVEFVETPWDAMFAALEANRFDVVANEVTINDERKAKYDLSEPYRSAKASSSREPTTTPIKIARRHQGQGGGRERDQQLGRRSRARPAHGSSPSRASPRQSSCSTRAGWTS